MLILKIISKNVCPQMAHFVKRIIPYFSLLVNQNVQKQARPYLHTSPSPFVLPLDNRTVPLS